MSFDDFKAMVGLSFRDPQAAAHRLMGQGWPIQARWMGGRPKCPMSAYSASAPVIVKTTAPIAMNAMPGRSTAKRIAQCGSRAVMMTG